MSRPICLDLYCGGGGISRGFDFAGFDCYGVDQDAGMLAVYPYPYLQADALGVMCLLLDGQGVTFSDGRPLCLLDISLFHASPPCQGYSIMNNLPWIKGRVYPLEIPAVRELFEATGKPYCIENVAGAASKRNLEKLGLLEHRLRAGWLCGGMFGLPLYRHRYFETNFFWPQPGHPSHRKVIRAGREIGQRAAAISYKGRWDEYKHTNPMGAASGKASLHNGAQASGVGVGQASGVGVGHAAGWHIAADAMQIDWMQRRQLTQAVPPVMTQWIGGYAMTELAVSESARVDETAGTF